MAQWDLLIPSLSQHGTRGSRHCPWPHESPPGRRTRRAVGVRAGDVIVIPAGVGHKNLGASPDLLVVGAYPAGQRWDLCDGNPDQRPQALQNIAAVPLPLTDPIFGDRGPLIDRWTA